MNNQRSHFRLEYPSSDRPTLVIEKKEFVVFDLSEGGCKFLLTKDLKPAPKSRLSGTVKFKSGKTCTIEGIVLRVNPDQSCVLLLSKGISLPQMMEEQRRLIQKYK